MGRFSPTRQQISALTGLAGVTQSISDRKRRKEDERLRDEDRDRKREQDELGMALQEFDLHEAGVRRGTAPKVDVQNDIFDGAQPGIAGSIQNESGLGSALQGMSMPEFAPPQPSNEVVHLPGAYIRDVGFTERALTEMDMVAHTQERFDRTRQQQDPNTVQLTDDRYIDRTQTPGARQGRAQQANDLAVLEAFTAMGATPEELQLLESDPEFRNEVFSLIQDREGPEEEAVTEEDLRAAGVPERSIAAALRDPALARQLINSHNRPEPRASDAQARTRTEGQRDAYISQLIAGGVEDDQMILAATERRFPDSPAALDDIRRVRGAGDEETPDVRTEERRKALEKLVPGGVTAFGGGPELEQVYQDLLDGVPVDQIRSEIEAAGLSESAAERIENYLTYVAPELEGLNGR